MKYKVGENVVHLTHGVGVVKSIESREFGDKTAEYYILEIEDNGAPKKVFVPTNTASERMRRIMNRSKFLEVQAILKSTVQLVIDHQTWNRRYREYMEQIHSGQAVEIARVFKSLIQLRSDKQLSFGEAKLLDQAACLLEAEMMLVDPEFCIAEYM